MRHKYQRRGNKFRYKYADPVTGKQRSRTGTVAELDAFCDELERIRRGMRYGRLTPELARRELGPLVGKDTVRDLWDAYFAGVTRVNTRAAGACAWKHRLEPYFASLRWFELDVARMREWQVKLRARYAPKSVEDAYTWLAAAYGLAVVTRRIEALPWGGWRPEKARETEPTIVGSLDEVVALIVAARSLDEREWERERPSYLAAAVLTFLLTGMRQGEACGLGWDRVEIDTDPALLRIDYQATRSWREECPGSDRPTVPPKGRTKYEHRVQVLHPSVVLALRHLREHLRAHNLYRSTGPVFPALRTHRGDWRPGRLIDPRQMRAIARLAGLRAADTWKTHTTRHSFGSVELVCSGGNLKATQQRIGHSSVKMLERYLHQMGHGLARSSVPELPELTQAAIPVNGEELPAAPLVETLAADGEPFTITTEAELDPRAAPPPNLPLAPLCDLVQANAARLQECARRRKEEQAELKRQSRRPFVELAEEWLHAPDPSLPRPRPVTEGARRHYARGYNKAKGAGLTLEQCRRAGQRAKRAYLGAWQQTLSRLQRQNVRGAPPPELPPAAP